VRHLGLRTQAEFIAHGRAYYSSNPYLIIVLYYKIELRCISVYFCLISVKNSSRTQVRVYNSHAVVHLVLAFCVLVLQILCLEATLARYLARLYFTLLVFLRKGRLTELTIIDVPLRKLRSWPLRQVPSE
jgi:hypothetical protein